MDYLCAPIAPDTFHTLNDHRVNATSLARDYTSITGRLIFVPQTCFMGEVDDKRREEILNFEIFLIRELLFERIVICEQECHGSGLTAGMSKEVEQAEHMGIQIMTYKEAIDGIDKTT
jgi:hypothetical protein